jgi:hypothetical protein
VKTSTPWLPPQRYLREFTVTAWDRDVTKWPWPGRDSTVCNSGSFEKDMVKRTAFLPIRFVQVLTSLWYSHTYSFVMLWS